MSETIRSQKACRVRRRRNDIPSLYAGNPTCRRTWCWDSPDRSRHQCSRWRDLLHLELVSMFCRRRLSCRDRDPLNRSRARPALQRKPYRSFPESPRSARCAPIFPIQRGSKFRLRRWIYKFRRRSKRCCVSTTPRSQPKHFCRCSDRSRSRRSIAHPARQTLGDIGCRHRPISKRRRWRRRQRG